MDRLNNTRSCVLGWDGQFVKAISCLRAYRSVSWSDEAGESVIREIALCQKGKNRQTSSK